jgi:hypothetical protein
MPRFDLIDAKFRKQWVSSQNLKEVCRLENLGDNVGINRTLEAGDKLTKN